MTNGPDDHEEPEAVVTNHSPSCRGHFCRNASGQLTYELHHVAGADYRNVCAIVRREFRLAAGELFVLLDEAMQEHRSKAGTVSLEWDNWTEFTVVAKDVESEPLVEAIGAFLGSSPTVERYVRQD